MADPVLAALAAWDASQLASATAASTKSSAPEHRDDAGSSDEDAVWQGVRQWTCAACTFEFNTSADLSCTVCDTPCDDAVGAPRAVITWQCPACTLENGGEEATCTACGTQRQRTAPQKQLLAMARSAWGAPLGSVHAPWSCASCARENSGTSITCDGCDSSRTGNGCVACSPRRACPAHKHLRLCAPEVASEAREQARLESWLVYESLGLRPLYRDDEAADQALLSGVDWRTRRATAAAMPRLEASSSRQAPTAEDFRSMYSTQRPEDVLFRLDTDWEEGREPRRRVQLLLAAGWCRVTGGGGHPKWRRELPHGAPAQVVTFSCTPSTHRAFDYDKTALHRLDVEAAEAIAAALASSNSSRPV